MKSVLLIVTTEMQLVSGVAMMLQDGNWDGCYRKLVLIQNKGRCLQKVAKLLSAKSIFSEVVFVEKEKLRKPSIKKWLLVPECREYWSLSEMFGLRKEGRGKKFVSEICCEEGCDRKAFDVVYWHTQLKEIVQVVRCVKDRGGESVLIDEGLQSYLEIPREKREMVDRIGLYCPEVSCFSMDERIPVVKISALNEKDGRVVRILKEVFPNDFGDEASVEVIWIGQNFSFSEVVSKVYDDLVEDFGKRFFRLNRTYEIREHPSLGQKNKTLRRSVIPFELEILLGYRAQPKEIHTVNSSVGVFVPVLLGKDCKLRVHFYHFVLLRESGLSDEALYPGMSQLLLRLKRIFPETVVLEE